MRAPLALIACFRLFSRFTHHVSGRCLPPLAFIACTALALSGCDEGKAGVSAGRVEVFFSPHGGCQDAIVREIKAARKTIRVQAYTFTNAKIAEALLDAKKRGINVEVILDHSEATASYTIATLFHNMGVPLLIDDKHPIAHNKIIIVDGVTIITGSYNFTKAAETENAENLVILRGFPEIVKEYETNYLAHRQHSVPYTRPAKGK